MNSRFQALSEQRQRQRIMPVDQSRRPSEVFGENVFNDKAMRSYLPRDTFGILQAAITQRKTLERNVAGAVATGIKSWAMDRGATHFTHWFQPLTGRTAEKHDSFLELVDGEAIDKFSGDELAQQEPDASSFPSGGLRTTFEARGYTAWDCSSPIFIFETDYGKTLCIPTIFVSYTGQALDFKIPLLRSMALLDEAATSLANLFDPAVKHVWPTLGAEQEYYLVDRSLFTLRPDLVMAGRTVLGAAPPKRPQSGTHYFGAIAERALAFMAELERESHRLGIPLRTRHNEVAPSQFECAPQHETLNVAVDHGLILMDLIDRVARKHQLAALLHEKPFAAVNGSGKHNNWSLVTDTGKNLLSPGPTPEENLMFLAFFVCVIRGIAQHGYLLQASIASAGNDLRLGLDEAPPSLLSVFVGSRLSKVLDDIENPPRRKKNHPTDELMHLGIAQIPELLLDNTDRNRTSPFAFTGNKFELRGVGASANSAGPMTLLNTIVAQQIQYFSKRVSSKVNRGRQFEAAIVDMLREYIVDSKSIRFEGDNYGDIWNREFEKRGLKTPKHAPEAYDAYLSDSSQKLLLETEVYSKQELLARYELLQQNFLSQRRLETDLLTDLIQTHILPLATEYQHELIQAIERAHQVGMAHLAMGQQQMAEQLGKLIADILKQVQLVKKARKEAEEEKGTRLQGGAYAERVREVAQTLRSKADELEGILPDDRWSLPKYYELLFLT